MNERDPTAIQADEARDAELDSLVETFLDQARRGESPSVEAFAEKHSAHRTRLRQLLPTLISLEVCANEEGTPKPNLPASIGEYQVLDLLGRGGMGVVYLAQHPKLDRKVAIKVLPPHLANDEKVLKRFRREANAISQLQHPNVVTIHELGCQQAASSTESDVHYFVMQYIEGASLDSVIRDRQTQVADSAETHRASLSATKHDEQHPELGRPSVRVNAGDVSLPKDRWQAVAKIGADAAAGLAHAHESEILHRDVKPSNLIVDRNGKTWVTDFGLAKLGNDDASQTDGVAGTLRFIAPERFRGWSDPRSDIYSLGVTLYEFATLQPAITGNDRAEIIANITRSRIESPRQIVSDIPRDLETIICKSVSAAPDARYETAEAMRDDLLRFLERQPIKARRLTAIERTRQWTRKNPSVAALLASVALLMALLTIGSSLAAFGFNDLATELKQERDTATRSLLLAYINEAHARTTSNRPGQRIEALKAIENAVQLLPTVAHDEEDILHMRNEMIAALILPDLELVRELPTDYSISHPSPDFTHIAQSVQDGLFRYCDASTGKVLWSYQFQGGELNSTSGNRFSPDSKYVAAFSHGTGRIRLFDCRTGEVLLTHQAKAWRIDGVEPISFDTKSKRLAICSHGDPIRVFEVLSPETAPQEIEVPFSVTRAFFHGDDKLIAYHPEQRRGDLIVHDLRSRETSVVKTRFRSAVCWKPVKDGLLASSADGTTGQLAWPEVDRTRFLISRTPESRTLEVGTEAGLLAMKSWGEDFHIVDAGTGNLVFPQWGERCKFSNDGHSAALSDGAKMRFYRIHSNRHWVETASVYGLGDHCLRMNDAGDLFLATAGREFQLWNFDELAILDGNVGNALSPAAHFLPDGRAIGIVDRKLAVFDIERSPTGTLLGPPEFLESAFSNWMTSASQVDRIAWQTPNGMLRIGPIADLSRAVEFEPRDAAAHAYFELSHDGRLLAIADGTVRLFDAETAEMIHDFGSEARGTPRSYFQFRPDGRQMICHTGAEHLLIDLATKRIVKRFPTSGYLGGADWSPDGSMLARAMDSETIALLDSNTFDELAQIRLANPLGIRTIRFSRDGESLLACVRHTQIHRLNLVALRRELAKNGLNW